jgi:hypothetical protein
LYNFTVESGAKKTVKIEPKIEQSKPIQDLKRIIFPALYWPRPRSKKKREENFSRHIVGALTYSKFLYVYF